MFKQTFSVCAAAGLTLLQASAVWAADRPPEKLTVTAVPIDFLQPTQIITNDDLLLKNAPTLGETLSNEPGISSTYFGPGASRPVVRGLQGSRVQVLTDSISTLDVADLSVDHAVPVETILADQVEIIRGPATLLYGSQAAGGVINVTDSRVPKQLVDGNIAGQFEVRGDTAANEETYVGRLDGSVGNFAWHLDGFDRDTDNIEIDGFATADPDERPDDERSGKLRNSFSEADSVAVGGSYVADRGYIGASVSWYNTTYGLPGPGEEEEGDDEPALFEGPFLDLEQTRIDVRGEYNFDDGPITSTKFAFGKNDYEHSEIEPSGEEATLFENDQWQLRWEALHREVAGFTGAFGVQIDDRDFSAVGEEAFVSPTDTDALGFFIVEEAGYDWGRLSFGARVESLEHDNDLFEDYDEDAYSFSVGVVVPVGDGNEFIANLSSTERNPNAEELYANGAHLATRQFEIGLLSDDPEAEGSADKEKAINYELGLQRNEGEVTYSASVYYYDFSDYVFFDLTGAEEDDLPVAVYRQEDAEFFGVEAAVAFPLWSRDSLDNTLRLFGDYVDAELDGDDDLPRIPPWRLGANLSFGPETWQAGLDVTYNAEQDNISSFNTDDFTMVDASFVYRLGIDPTDWELYVRGTNLLDEDARRATSFIAAFAPLPGRNFVAGARVRF